MLNRRGAKQGSMLGKSLFCLRGMLNYGGAKLFIAPEHQADKLRGVLNRRGAKHFC